MFSAPHFTVGMSKKYIKCLNLYSFCAVIMLSQEQSYVKLLVSS
jgi:hypothetical protein